MPGKAQVLEQKSRPNNFKVLPALLYFDLKPLHKIVYLSTAYTLASQNPSILVCVISSGYKLVLWHLQLLFLQQQGIPSSLSSNACLIRTLSQNTWDFKFINVKMSLELNLYPTIVYCILSICNNYYLCNQKCFPDCIYAVFKHVL